MPCYWLAYRFPNHAISCRVCQFEQRVGQGLDQSIMKLNRTMPAIWWHTQTIQKENINIMLYGPARVRWRQGLAYADWGAYAYNLQLNNQVRF